MTAVMLITCLLLCMNEELSNSMFLDHIIDFYYYYYYCTYVHYFETIVKKRMTEWAVKVMSQVKVLSSTHIWFLMT